MNGFDQVAKSPLEEWIYYLNTGEIPSSATAPGLEEARERLKLDSMTKDELAAYYRHLDNIVILRDNIYTEREEGGSVVILGGLSLVNSLHAYTFASLKRKKLISTTPLNDALNALILALNASAAAFVLLFTKKFKILS